ncbi:MAG: sulfur oxidation c-type cytochrome SoxA [Aestuariivirgaceae bacterium]
MKVSVRTGLAAAVAVVGIATAGVAVSGENLPEGITAIKTAPPSKEHPLDELISGWNFRSAETQALQQDDFENPGFLWVEQGESLWQTVDGSAGKSCASCHNDAADSMKGVGAEMPKWDAKLGRPLTMEQRINNCRAENMGAETWKWESSQMLAMTAYVRNQSRGMPVNVQVDGPMKEWADSGKELYYQRVGQLDMSCANCHEGNYGKYIRADHLSQGHSNGFPTYRLKWQKLGSLHRRFKGCMANIRATPYKRGSDEFVALEIYLAHRGQGLQVETPAVRQ